MTDTNAYLLRSDSADATKALGCKLAPCLEAGDVVLLFGDLGAGKTQFVQGVARGLGIHDDVTSPTFNILLEYRGTLPLYHFDLYRLDPESPDQLEDIDFFGVVEGDGASFIEWGDRFPNDMPEDRMEVSLTVGDDQVRTLRVRATGARSAQLADAWRQAVEGGRE